MKFQRRLKPQATVDLVPMIDVVFQLVVFFMVSTTFIITPGIGLTFPASTTAEPVVMTKMVVTVKSREEIYLNQERLNISLLGERLNAISTGAEDPELERTIILEGDKEVPYSLIIEVLDVLRKNGFQDVNLKTRKMTGIDGDESG
jgi:biopolymer transport protein ExbD